MITIKTAGYDIKIQYNKRSNFAFYMHLKKINKTVYFTYMIQKETTSVGNFIGESFDWCTESRNRKDLENIGA